MMKISRSITLVCCVLALALLSLGCGIPPMYWAIYHNENARVDSMITAGQDVNVRWLQSSPLHQAVGADNYQAVLLLLQHGADPLVKDQHKRTPLMLAQKRNKDPRIIRTLEEAEAVKLGKPLLKTTMTADPGYSQSAPAARPAKGTTLSVMDLNVTSGLSSKEVVMLTDKLINEFVSCGAFTVVERSKRDEILKEQGFQQSGACDEGKCLVEAGQLLGVQKMVGGTIGRLGTVYAVELRVMDVKTGAIDQPFSREYSGDVSVLLGAMREAATTFSGISGGFPKNRGRQQ